MPDVSSDLIDDCEDGDHLTKLGTKWFTYADDLNKGASIVIPKTTLTSNFKMADGGGSASLKAAKITFTLDKGGNAFNPFVGLGFPLNPLSDSTPVDLSKSSGLTFYYKGASADVRVETLDVTDFGFFFHRLPATPEWTLVSLKWSDFAQAIWAVKADFNLAKATKIAWQTINTGKTGDAGEIWVDEIHLPGFTVTTALNADARKNAQGLGKNEAGRSFDLWTPTYIRRHDPKSERFDVSGKSLLIPQ